MSADEHFKQYMEAIANDPDIYSSFEDYLGANALQMCEGCDQVVEYDEVDENGYCFDCQDGDEDDEDEDEDEEFSDDEESLLERMDEDEEGY